MSSRVIMENQRDCNAPLAAQTDMWVFKNVWQRSVVMGGILLKVVQNGTPGISRGCSPGFTQDRDR